MSRHGRNSKPLLKISPATEFLPPRRARLWTGGHQTVNVAIHALHDAMKDGTVLAAHGGNAHGADPEVAVRPSCERAAIVLGPVARHETVEPKVLEGAEVLVLDEATSALDAKSQDKMMEIVVFGGKRSRQVGTGGTYS